ncbi:MAG: GAF domain-containing sensor histidine kinase [Gemmatimonadaceae bacterium]|nr:GAF domain-containing sensor histidine kinase [Gemmatimonadaceae bacterium]
MLLQPPLPPSDATVVMASQELAATLLQGVVTVGLAGLSAHFYHRYRRPFYAHQVTTGWTALALLWASLVFARDPRWRPGYLAIALFPVVWSYVAIYVMDEFLLAALPSVLFLSFATAWSAWTFWRYAKQGQGSGARLLAGAFALWSLHHLDYPFLRRYGAWTPWGYYLDIAFELLVGAGLVVLVLDDVGRGMRALTALSGDLQRRAEDGDLLAVVASRVMTLPGVRATALALGGEIVRSAGPWGASVADIAPLTARVLQTRRPQVARDLAGWRYVAALPVEQDRVVVGALLMAGDLRNPFTALDDSFLLALGQQVGAALKRADLDRRLAERSAELTRLSTAMVDQHEEERLRISRALHDETAQVFGAVKMQLDGLRTSAAPPQADRLARLAALMDTGIRSIRTVTEALRPALLDDLGLLPALRSLAASFGERTGLVIEVRSSEPWTAPPLSPDVELALYRALQEALANVARHADARRVEVTLSSDARWVGLEVEDDGDGFDPDFELDTLARRGHMGLAGMRERIHRAGGTVTLGRAALGGARVQVRVPLPVTVHAVPLPAGQTA